MLERFRSRLATMLQPRELQSAGPDVEGLYRLLLQRAPPKRSTSELIAAFKTVPEFRAVVSKIADHVASVHWRLYVVRNGKSGKVRRVRSGYIADPVDRRKELTRFRQAGELEEITDHPMAAVFDRANPVMSGYAVRRLQQIYVDVTGESFSVLTRNVLGVPDAVWPVPPHWVTLPEPHRPTFQLRIRGRLIEVDPGDMLWSRDLDPLNPYLRGTGIGEALGDELDISDFSAKYVKAFFYNYGKPDLMIAVEGATKEQAEAAKTEMEQEHRGYSRAHRTWWTSGKLTVKELNAHFADMQVVDLKASVRDQFVNTFGIPPEILGIITKSNRATIREALRLFVIETVVPRLERNRQEYQDDLAPMFDDRLVVDYDDPVPVDTADQLVSMKAAPWAPTRGEWRETQGLEHRGEIDEIHYVQAALIPSLPGDATDDTEPAMPEPKHVFGQKESQVDSVLEVLRPERLQTELDPIWQTEVAAWGDEALADLGIGASFDMLNPLVTEHLEQFSTDRIGGLVNGTTRKQLQAELSAGVSAGEGAQELAKRVRNTFAAAKGHRAVTIARTEVTRSANLATWGAHKQSGIVEKRQWVATADGATRDEHVNLNGTIVGIDEPFTYDGYAAMYPGGFAAAYLSINCRCTTVAVIEDPKSLDQLDALWKVFDRRLLSWENQTRAGLERGFRKQQTDVLKALERVFRSNGHDPFFRPEPAPEGVAFM